MKFCALASGSSGNSQYIETDEKKILIDAGLSGVRIEKLLQSIGVKPENLDAIFVTHEHKDHAKGVGILARRYGLKVFANENTWEAMASTIKKVPSNQCFVIHNHTSFSFGDLYIMPIATFHDCVEGTGYVIGRGKKKISIITDTGWVNDKMKSYMEDSDLYYLEANHDEDMVINGPYSFPLKQRILSNRGHLSNAHAGSVLGELLQKKGEKVVLAHLSEDNNVPLLAARTVRDLLYQKGIHEGVDFTLEVAKRHQASKIYEL
ncbi:MAG: MBL fold metallo-hydrolase [Tissierellia bacterium]|nr:MBL fold metallo-hydrolase [Tissierellia bacterium]